DLVLAWADDDAEAIDDARIKTRWPQSQGSQKIAGNLFLVRGVEPPESKGIPGPVAPPVAQESPIQLAEQMLTTARRSRDDRRITSAVTDLDGGLLRHRRDRKSTR